MEPHIKIHGDTVKEIKPGDIFTPVFDSVEGHDMVTLVRNSSVKSILAKYVNGSITIDQLVKFIRELTSIHRVTV